MIYETLDVAPSHQRDSSGLAVLGEAIGAVIVLVAIGVLVARWRAKLTPAAARAKLAAIESDPPAATEIERSAPLVSTIPPPPALPVIELPDEDTARADLREGRAVRLCAVATCGARATHPRPILKATGPGTYVSNPGGFRDPKALCLGCARMAAAELDCFVFDARSRLAGFARRLAADASGLEDGLLTKIEERAHGARPKTRARVVPIGAAKRTKSAG